MWDQVIADEYNLRQQVADHTNNTLNSVCKECDSPVCCMQMFEVTPWDALLIIRTHPQAVTRLIPKLEEQAELEKKYAGEMEEYIHNERHPCAFLTADGKCEIYAMRPIICAMMHIREGEKRCGDMDAKEKHAVGLLPELTVRYLSTTHKVWEGVDGQQGMRHFLLENGMEDIPFGFIPGLATAILAVGEGKKPPMFSERDMLMTELRMRQKGYMKDAP